MLWRIASLRVNHERKQLKNERHAIAQFTDSGVQRYTAPNSLEVFFALSKMPKTCFLSLPFELLD